MAFMIPDQHEMVLSSTGAQRRRMGAGEEMIAGLVEGVYCARCGMTQADLLHWPLATCLARPRVVELLAKGLEPSAKDSWSSGGGR